MEHANTTPLLLGLIIVATACSSGGGSSGESVSTPGGRSIASIEDPIAEIEQPQEPVLGREVAQANGGSSGMEKARGNWTRNPWWPLTPGNSWTFKKKDNKHPLTITVQPQQEKFGCGSYPIHLYFEKKDLDAYWGPGLDNNLHWMLGVQPDGTVMGYGHYVSDMKGVLASDTMNYKSNDPNFPAYYLIPSRPFHNQAASGRHALPTVTGITNECIPDDNNYFSQWNVTWTLTNVSTPGYTGPALKAAYDEQSGHRQIEDWYFAHGIGIVRIVVKDADGKEDIDMALESYKLNDPASIDASGRAASGTNAVIPKIQFSASKTMTIPDSVQTVIEARPGERIYYNWNVSDAVRVSSFYSGERADTCINGLTTANAQVQWTVSSNAGLSAIDILPCQVGQTYNYTVQAVSSTGHMQARSLSVKVINNPVEVAPSVKLSLSATQDLKYKVFTVGDSVSYSWKIENAAKVESFYYSSARDFCFNGFGPLDTLKPWAVTSASPPVGSTTSTLLECQAARAYTVVLIGYSASGKQVARDQVVVQLTGTLKQRMEVAANTLPQSWDVWVWYLNTYTGKQTPPLESFVPNFDSSKRYAKVPLDTWWACTQENNCAAMKQFYGPSVTITPNLSYAVPESNPVEGRSYAVIKGLGFSLNGDNAIVSNCGGLEKVYDGIDGGKVPGIRQINVRVPAKPQAQSCTFQVRKPDGSQSNTITLTMPKAQMISFTFTNAGWSGNCEARWIIGTSLYSDSIAVTIRAADWSVLTSLSILQVPANGSAISFGIPESLRIKAQTEGLRFTIENPYIRYWDTTELVKCP